MPLPANDVQLRVERSIFEAIRLKLVYYGYLPDITNARYTSNSTGQVNFQTDLEAIREAQGFAAEVFGHSSSLDKGNKRTPRLAILTRRIMPGDIGTSIDGGFSPDPLNPDSTIKIIPSLQSANLHIDINVVPGTSAEDRFLHAILAEVLSTLKYIQLYDNPQEWFLIRQFNFYDLPDNKNGIEEKVYSYEIPDLYLYEGQIVENIALINQITVNTTVQQMQTILTRTGSLIGPFVDGETIYMDLSGLKYKTP
jgi:hypothetical protein